MTDLHRFGDSALTATVSAEGAELRGLRDAAGREWMWGAGPAWPRSAPVLFPIVGRLPGDALRHGGRTHRMTQHGFARDRRFAWVRRDAGGCALRLTDDAATREAYPFAFALEMAWAVEDGAIRCEATVLNPGEAVLPFFLGAHPAFAWPLPGAGAGEHRLEMGGAALRARRLTDGLVDGAEVVPLEDGALHLRPALFEADAIVLPDFPGRRLRYAAPGGAAIEMGWEGYRDLGIWSKPGAAFLCLEPWFGTAAPLGWRGEFAERPGIGLLPPGGSRRFLWWARPVPREG